MLDRIEGELTDYDGEYLYYKVVAPPAYIVEKRQFETVEVTLTDSRSISAKQRAHAYALFRDCSLHTGHTPEEIKELLKYDFISRTGQDEFSLSNCDMTTARLFIDHLVEFCLTYDIPCQDSLLDHAEDIARYLYLCLVHRKCALCGKRSEVHHVDAVGMGRNRKEIVHAGMRAMALCRKHHNEAHNTGQLTFNSKYKVFGIKLDEFLCKKLKLGRTTNA